MAVSSAYSRRPSATEPWRYACPDCGSVSLELLVSGKRPRGATYPANGHGVTAARRDSAKRFRCIACLERKASVVDQKTGREVRRL